MLKEQTIAPNFTLINAEEKTVSLSDYSNKWVLIYFHSLGVKPSPLGDPFKML